MKHDRNKNNDDDDNNNNNNNNDDSSDSNNNKNSDNNNNKTADRCLCALYFCPLLFSDIFSLVFYILMAIQYLFGCCCLFWSVVNLALSYC